MDDPVVGRKYRVKIEDCCVSGEFTSVLTGFTFTAAIEEDSPKVVEGELTGLTFENGVVLEEIQGVTLEEVETPAIPEEESAYKTAKSEERDMAVALVGVDPPLSVHLPFKAKMVTSAEGHMTIQPLEDRWWEFQQAGVITDAWLEVEGEKFFAMVNLQGNYFKGELIEVRTDRPLLSAELKEP